MIHTAWRITLCFLVVMTFQSVAALDDGFQSMESGGGECETELSVYRGGELLQTEKISASRDVDIRGSWHETIKESCEQCGRRKRTREKELQSKGVFFFETRCIFRSCSVGNAKITLELENPDLEKALVRLKIRIIVPSDGNN